MRLKEKTHRQTKTNKQQAETGGWEACGGAVRGGMRVRTRRTALSMVLAAALNLVLNYFLIPRFGALGAASRSGASTAREKVRSASSKAPSASSPSRSTKRTRPAVAW